MQKTREDRPDLLKKRHQMKDEDKAKEQLIDELGESRQRIAELEASEAERKQAEEALKPADELYRAVFNSTNSAISVINVDDFRIVAANNAFLQQLGMREEEVIGKT